MTVLGLDDIWMQTVHASRRYGNRDLVWGARLVDGSSEAGDVLTLDLTKFHELEPNAPTAELPYPKI